MRRPPLPQGPALVVGLARSGHAALAALEARGVPARGVDREQGDDGPEALEGAAWVVKSPGVPPSNALVSVARASGLPVMGELELAWRLLPNEFIAVTGTNGKTTTTELLGAIHREAGIPYEVVGNIGVPATSVVAPPHAVVIAEASSFQLHDTIAFAPDAAALLNVTPDHEDWHGSLRAYEQAKLQAFARQGPDALAVADRRVPGRARRIPPLEVRDGAVWAGGERFEVRLRGPHNLQNAAFAGALALARDVPRDAVRGALAAFPGVVHRLEEVAEKRGVLWINDSKATNVGSTVVALEAFSDRPRHVILGGRGKGQDFGPLAGHFEHAYLIGEDASRLADAVGGELCETLERAVEAARAAARQGDVVLLSPACASWDQFRDFEERGERFRALVMALP